MTTLMAITVDIHSDVICPWCWIGKRRLEQAVAKMPFGSVKVRWHPFQLNPGMPVQGMPRAEYRRRKFGSAEQAQALDARLEEVAGQEGLPFDLAAQTLTPNTLLAHRLIWLAGRRGVQDAVVEALFSAYFSAGLDVGDPSVLVRIGNTNGLATDDVRDFLAGHEGEREVVESERAIRRQHVGGVPLFVINGREHISGAQPPAVFRAALTQAAGAVGGASG
jgi:predicted DsbA family dithiol-disulfide isomerase